MRNDLAELTALNRATNRRRAELRRQTLRRNSGRGVLLLQSRQVAGRPRRLPPGDRGAGDDPNLEAHDVKIRIMGDTAIIHAATR